MAKYWFANNPNSECTNDEATALGALSQTEIELLDGASAGTVANSKSVIYSSAGQVKGTSFNGAEGVVYGSSGVITSGSTYLSGAMAVPANSIITSLGCVVTVQLAASSGVWGVKFGTAAEGVQLAALDADGLEASGTTVAVGIGCSTIAEDNTALGGTAVIVQVAGTPYRASATDVHGTVLSAGGTITGGNVTFWAKYVQIA